MLELKHIFKKIEDRYIINDLSIVFPDYGFVGIKGESGCGKSSLLYILGMIDSEFEGEVCFNGEAVNGKKTYIQNNVAYMMQNKDYIDALTVKENIMLASQVGSCLYDLKKLYQIAHQLDIKELLDVYPHQLSGGQLKRMSIAKALLKNSAILLCDEPTGALHQKQAHEVMCLLKDASRDRLVIIVSHDDYLLDAYCDYVLSMDNGKLYGKLSMQKKEYFEVKKKYYPLWIYPFRQLLYQKNKIIFLFIFQWILIVASVLIITGMNGYLAMINNDEKHAVLANVATIERKDHLPFDNLIKLSGCDLSYDYHLNQLSLNNNKQIEFQLLPQDMKHIQIKKGRLPSNSNEIIVSDSYGGQLDEFVDINYFQEKIRVKIVGILKPALVDTQRIYLPLSFRQYIPLLEDHFVLRVESTSSQQDLYNRLSKDYHVYHEVLERVESYQGVLSLAKQVFYAFLLVSVVISLLLIRIVLSILYFQRRHDVAYLMSLGIENSRLRLITIIEAMGLGAVIALGGIILSAIVYEYLNNVYMIERLLSIKLLMTKWYLCKYDLYIVIGIIYMLMCMIGAISPVDKMLKTDVKDVLREE